STACGAMRVPVHAPVPVEVALSRKTTEVSMVSTAPPTIGAVVGATGSVPHDARMERRRRLVPRRIGAWSSFFRDPCRSFDRSFVVSVSPKETTMEATLDNAVHASISTRSRWAGRVISGLAVLFLLFDL